LAPEAVTEFSAVPVPTVLPTTFDVPALIVSAPVLPLVESMAPTLICPPVLPADTRLSMVAAPASVTTFSVIA
jgi:hypothetical protein